MAEEETYILITGTNRRQWLTSPGVISGLGFSTCCRLMDEFLVSRPDNQSLTLIFTTRSEKKSNETLAQLKNHLRATAKKLWGLEGLANAESRITFKPEHVDLCDLLSVRFHGQTIYIGVMNRKQTSQPDEPPMGKIFCANVFGHYMLTHYLLSVLGKSTLKPARVIWTSSLESTRDLFSVNDMQGLKVAESYQSVKYLTDLLILTEPLSSSAPWADKYLTPSTCSGMDTNAASYTRPKMYLSHPGICSTSIVPLALPLIWSMMFVSWIARLMGSPWHVIDPYSGANATVWLSLSPKSTLDGAEAEYERLGGGKPKWGSACDRFGKQCVASTEVEGWGYAGVVGPAVLEADKSRRRKRGATDLTAEEKATFVDAGRDCWKQMETLRLRWEDLLSREEANDIKS
ncbi:3-ketosteroid reductase [Trichophyton equinum CBS 127.97]|uniref:3-ketosteroid reductase n=1 Tax=Trichophyton equinum (strain ATCC MYA-4606 / CBS 127.97) TaxID=559882 RepID=F2Q5E6_TRIEC|nr:3-ketosteroid reductase [Trichophyton equinum CBS 127.97]